MSKTPKPRGQRAATLADVGRAAGVSAVVASTVLNGARSSSRVSPETRQRILECAARLAYRPNAAARALVARRMQTIGIVAVFQGIEFNHYFIELFNGALTSATRNGQFVTVFTLHNWDTECEQLPRFCDGRVDGLVLIGPMFGPDLAEQLPQHIPFVSVHANVELPGIINIESDEETGAYILVRHLIAMGHRRVLHLCGPRERIGSQRRIAGYERALTEAGIAIDPAMVAEADYSVHGGKLTLKSWFQQHVGQPMPQAIFCANDRIAIGCIEVLSECGIRVPHDVSVAGFDDTLAARLTVPQLTTVRQPLRDMGARAVQVLLQQIHHRHEATTPPVTAPIVFPTEVVLRASVTPPPSKSKLIAPLPPSRL